MFSEAFVCPRGFVCSGGLCPGGVSLQGDRLWGGLCHGDPPLLWKSGQYTSYWNAFLFLLYICIFGLWNLEWPLRMNVSWTTWKVIIEKTDKEKNTILNDSKQHRHKTGTIIHLMRILTRLTEISVSQIFTPKNVIWTRFIIQKLSMLTNLKCIVKV